jgi:hypothetical protein
MFVRIKTLSVNGRTYRYLHLVENRWENGKVRQHVIGSLGRLDEIQQCGDLERVITQLVEHCPTVRILRAQAEGRLHVEKDRLWGPVLVFERLWEELGLKTLLAQLAAGRRFAFNFERLAFALVLQRILAPGSDLQGSQWIHTLWAEGFGALELKHFYRGVGFLWRKKEEIESALYRRGLDLFNQELDVVFFDTTSTYFEGLCWEGWAKRGKSRDHRPDHLQLVIGIVMRRDGLPVACEIWPGNTADVTTLKPIVERLQKRLGIRKVIVVCDRGMVSRANLELLTQAGFEYIVGMKLRRAKEVEEEVLSRAGAYAEVDAHLEVKEVWVGERRYVVCRNAEEAQKDRHDREALLVKIQEKLKGGGLKALIANRGYKRFLKVQGKAAEIDEAKISAEARLDGKFVLHTNTALPTGEVAEAYKQLTGIERMWRELKDVVELRPIFHHIKRENVKGHIFSCFLTLYVTAVYRLKLAASGAKIPWKEGLRDLSSLRALQVNLDGHRYLFRTPVKGNAGAIFAAVGLKLPPLAQPLPR